MITIHFPDSATEDRFNREQEYDNMYDASHDQLDEIDIEDVKATPANNVAGGILSPDATLKHPIIINNLAFPSIKHGYWALLIQGDREDRRTIANLTSGSILARRMWNEKKHPNWSALRFPVMGVVTHLAIRSNPEMKRALGRMQDVGLVYEPGWKDEFFAAKGNYVAILKKLRDATLHESRSLVPSEIEALKRMGVDISEWEAYDTTVWAACIWEDAEGEHKILTTPELAGKWVRGGENRRIEKTRTISFQDPYEMTITKGIKTSRWIGERKEMQTLNDNWRRANKGYWFMHRRQMQTRTDDGKVVVLSKYTG